MAIGPFLLGRHFCRSEESNVKKNIYWDTCSTSWHYHTLRHLLTNWLLWPLMALRAIVPSILEYSATIRNCGYFGPFCCVGIAHWHRIDGIERAAVVNMKFSIFRVSDQKITFRASKFLELWLFFTVSSVLPPRKRTIRCAERWPPPIIKLFANFVNFTKFTGPFLGLAGQAGSGRNGQSEKFIGH